MKEVSSGDATGPEGAITGMAWRADDAQFGDDPSEYYRWLRDEEPVHFHAASNSYFLSRFDDVWQATEDWQTFSSESPVARLRHMASSDPPDHDRLRAAVAKHFSPRAVAGMEDRVRGICREILEPLEAENRFDLVTRFSTLYPSRVIHRLMGVPRELDEPLRSIALGIGAAKDTATLAEGMEELEELTARVIQDESASDGPGILQHVQAEFGTDPLSTDELRGLCSNLVLAGTDTVTNLIGNGVVLLSRRPEARVGLVRDPRGILNAIEEMLRFDSPVQSLARRVVRDVTLHGVALPRGAEVRLQWGAANRDDREFDTPDDFRIDRSIRRHLALGHGRHFCLGAGLARLEARIAFEELLARWPDLQIDEGKLSRLPSLWVRAWKGIEISKIGV
jgi:cytochrome P450 family 130